LRHPVFIPPKSNSEAPLRFLFASRGTGTGLIVGNLSLFFFSRLSPTHPSIVQTFQGMFSLTRHLWMTHACEEKTTYFLPSQQSSLGPLVHVICLSSYAVIWSSSQKAATASGVIISLLLASCALTPSTFGMRGRAISYRISSPHLSGLGH